MKLGDTVKDKVTGFTGQATARCEYLGDSPDSIQVETSDKSKWITADRLEVVPETE